MTADVIDGRAVAKQLADEVRGELAELAARGVTCGLATVLVGTDYAAAAYERRLRTEADELGITYRHYFLGADSEQHTVERVVRDLGADPAVHGVLVLRPLPAHLDEGRIFQALEPAKDIESVHPENAGLLALGTPRFVPSTPAAVFHVLDGWLAEQELDPVEFYRRSTIAVVGRSSNVGRPAVSLAFQRQAVVVSCDEWASRTDRLAAQTRLGDVLIVAAGVPGLIRAEHVAPGAIVLDVGINPVTGDDGRVRLVGDVALDEVAEVARAVTPVPGGIGPVTDVWLMRNTAAAAAARLRT
ncbi:bifunctional 5,10-methylenetetrahydrofolate dehydrogenase/5,10-methenyltetrahydrofolate cyclohydrolase [Pseudonocardia sp. CA-107938]|uniref:bifunctional 5,10-methylenetetrahydrofolate dehydrogenase/5,10-methenyltetrahydrofolate cyclohydrolase n=1 Tax=Pseudonocardia sp. CA-107938 TaxID=3240021 RepID=UPI003D93D059